MHGKTTLSKSFSKIKHSEAQGRINRRSYVEVGNWRFQENEDGDLVIINLETDKITKLLRKED